jgi:uncharacterized protein (TIGR02646 family)
MSLGPGRLSHAPVRSILKRKEYRAALQAYLADELDWTDASLTDVKALVRRALRYMQAGRCVYCRRLLVIERRNSLEDIEHFLDKSKAKYRKWSFCSVNVSLSCHPCNLEKSTKDLGLNDLGQSKAYSMNPKDYRWIHPYLTDFHENIKIGKGWTYEVQDKAPSPAEAEALIKELKLYEIQRIESYSEGVKKRIYDLTVRATKCLEDNEEDLAKTLLAESLKLQEETSFD